MLARRPLGAAVAHRPIHEAGGTEPAAPFAPAAPLDQEHVAEDRVGTQYLRRRLALVEACQVATHHAGRERPVVVDRDQRAVVAVAGVETVGPVGTDDLLRAFQDGVPFRLPRHCPLEELGKHLLRLADEDEIDELGERLGIEEHRRAASHHQRCPRPSRTPAQRQAGRFEHVEDVQVVGLEGDGEREHVEVAERPVALERPQRLRPTGTWTVRHESPLDRDVRIVVQQPEHCLEPQVGHADRVGVGVDQADRERPPGTGGEEPPLGGQAGEAIAGVRHAAGLDPSGGGAAPQQGTLTSVREGSRGSPPGARGQVTARSRTPCGTRRSPC